MLNGFSGFNFEFGGFQRFYGEVFVDMFSRIRPVLLFWASFGNETRFKSNLP